MNNIGHEDITRTEQVQGLELGTVKELINSLISNGGFTYSINGQPTPCKGYAVSIQGREQVYNLSTANAGLILSYIAANSDKLKTDQYFFGAWIDGKRLYLDVSTVILDQENALKFGRDNRQLAIYAIERGETIRL